MMEMRLIYGDGHFWRVSLLSRRIPDPRNVGSHSHGTLTVCRVVRVLSLDHEPDEGEKWVSQNGKDAKPRFPAAARVSTPRTSGNR